ncbi:Hypothetical protein CINCED_3A006190 [Cinara cedri]|uniref:Uncharacterized protein n=1 Tax=Cinara cedri TaxID=506608 RepID=A0A5E4NPK0_9HEMI|nr:Hypothetical protein CINCED_3A006190 [Cinara cedri]
MRKDRRYYHVVDKFELIEVVGVQRVRRKRDLGIMAVIDNFTNIIIDIHVAIRHKGETKTHKKIKEHYSNIPMSNVKNYIANCDRCMEKSTKKYERRCCAAYFSFIPERARASGPSRPSKFT